jgi:hypothetical protein
MGIMAARDKMAMMVLLATIERRLSSVGNVSDSSTEKTRISSAVRMTRP